MAETKTASKCPFCGQDRGMGPGVCPHCKFDEDVAKEDYGSVEEAVSQIKERHRRASLWKIAVPVPQPATTPGEPQDPVLNGPNPMGTNFEDNAQNSPEQEAAFQHWVNLAVNELNRGVDPRAVVAKLAHDGCPDPEQAVATALAQPFEEEQPVEETLTEAPPAQPDAAAEVSETTPPMGMQDKVRVAGREGVELDRYSDLWGRGIVRVALDNGQVVEVEPEQVEEFEAERENPVSDIQAFIDSFPPVAPHDLPSIKANIDNWSQVKSACRQLLAADPLTTGLSISQQIELGRIESEANENIWGAKTAARMYLSDEDQAYLSRPTSTQRLAEILPQAQSDLVPRFDGNVEEAAAVWAADHPWSDDDEDGFRAAARRYASAALNLDDEGVAKFADCACDHAVIAEEEAPEEKPVYDDGPAEQLFL